LSRERGHFPARRFFVRHLDAEVVLAAEPHLPCLTVGSFVVDADAQCFETVEYVELGDAQTGNAGDLRRMPQRNRVDPAAAARAPRGGTELGSATREPLTDVVETV